MCRGMRTCAAGGPLPPTRTGLRAACPAAEQTRRRLEARVRAGCAERTPRRPSGTVKVTCRDFTAVWAKARRPDEG